MVDFRRPGHICCQNNAKMRIVRVSAIFGIAYKNVTSGIRNEAQ